MQAGNCAKVAEGDQSDVLNALMATLITRLPTMFLGTLPRRHAYVVNTSQRSGFVTIDMMMISLNGRVVTSGLPPAKWNAYVPFPYS